MNIKTKFNLNDEVYYMEDNKPCKSFIKQISVNINYSETLAQMYINYTLAHSSESFAEKDLYSNIEQLKNSIFENII